ncbi:MAG: PmoA family protein [Halobacteriales archaeon]
MSQTLPVAFEHDPDAERVDVTVGGELFTAYRYDHTLPGLKKPVLHPILTPGGNHLTRGYPVDPRPEDRRDHLHHAGLWFSYGNVNGTDFWNNNDEVPEDEREEYGVTRHRGIERAEGGDDGGELTVRMAWLTPDDRAVLDQETTYAVRGRPGERVLDHRTTLSANEDVTLFDDKEGLLCVRLARELEHPPDETIAGPAEDATSDPDPTGEYLTSEGVRGTDAWGTRARWIRLTGALGGEDLTVGVLDHPGNVGHPTHWVARGYGPLGPNPIAPSIFEDADPMDLALAAGESLAVRYRIIVHDGTLPPEALEDRYRAFAGAEGS